MDLPPWVNSAADVPDEPDDDVARRLRAVESRLGALDERLETLASSLQESVREVVAKDVEAVAADLRHTVSDLGRLLVREVGRLSKILAEHRDTILAELRGRPSPTPPVTAAPEPPSAPTPARTAGPAIPSIPVADGGDAPEPGAPAGWRAGRRRRRDD